MSPEAWTFSTAEKIRFGLGVVDGAGVEARSLGPSLKRALIVTDKGVVNLGLVERVKSRLQEAGFEVDVFDEVKPDPSTEEVQRCVEFGRAVGCDLMVGLGGGSPMDTAKASACLVHLNMRVVDCIGVNRIPTPSVPVVAIPTTAGTGAEVTNSAVVVDRERVLKDGIFSPHIKPRIALVDPSLTFSLPPTLTATTGIDALTHAVESYMSLTANPLTDVIALDAVRLIAENLRAAVAEGSNVEARCNMCLASLMGGITFPNAGLTAVHAMAHMLGARYGSPHGLTNAVLLPYIMEFNVVSSPLKFAKMAEAMGVRTGGLSLEEAASKAVESVKVLAEDVGIPKKLEEYAASEGDIELLAGKAMSITRLMRRNPRLMTFEDVKEIYKKVLQP